MAHDNTSKPPARRSASPPPARATLSPSVHLPSSAGLFAQFGSRTTVALRNGKFVEAHAQWLKARASQSNEMAAVIDARINLAVSLARLIAIDDIIENEHVLAHMERQHNVRMRRMHFETKEALAEVELAQARARLHPHRQDGPAATDEFLKTIDDLVAQMPDVSEDSRNTLRELLLGALKEKKL